MNNELIFDGAYWISEYIRKRGWAHAPVFRKHFNVENFSEAQCAICGLGFFELRLNGRKVSEDLMTPTITRYDVHCEYLLYDVTDYLVPGENIVEVVLGNGMFNQITNDVFRSEHPIWKSDPKFILNLLVDNRSVLVSDRDWLVAHGPIVSNSIRTGEKFDARIKLADWVPGEKPDPEVWQRVYWNNSPGGELYRSEAPACRVTQELAVADSWQTADGATIYDFGVNIAGNCRITVSGSEGSTVKLIHGEKLTAERDLDNAHIGLYTFDEDFQSDCYTLNGEAEQSWNPTFGYHGFRYVKVVCTEGAAQIKSIIARVIRSNFAVIGNMTTDCDDLNKLSAMALRSLESNFVNIPTDCPHREKMGWTGDAQLAAELALWHYDAKDNYRSWLHSMRSCQRLDGQVPGMVPYSDHWQFGPVWDGALIILPWQIWRFTGDDKVVHENYDAGKKLMKYFASLEVDGIVEIGPGDWCHVEQDLAITGIVDATAYYCVCARCMRDMAQLLGKPDDASCWQLLADKVKAAFQREFCRGDGHCFGDQSTALALALTFDLAPENERAVMAERLNKRMQEINCHADFGISGAKAVPRALAENGYFDTALKVLTQREYPGWGWWLEQGATSFWETWKGDQSRNHVMFGDVGAWVWEFAGGLHPEASAEGAGFRRFLLTPPSTELLSSFSGKYLAGAGEIVWTWNKTAGGYRGTLTVPENCSCIFRSAGSAEKILASGTHELVW